MRIPPPPPTTSGAVSPRPNWRGAWPAGGAVWPTSWRRWKRRRPAAVPSRPLLLPVPLRPRRRRRISSRPRRDLRMESASESERNAEWEPPMSNRTKRIPRAMPVPFEMPAIRSAVPLRPRWNPSRATLPLPRHGLRWRSQNHCHKHRHRQIFHRHIQTHLCHRQFQILHRHRQIFLLRKSRRRPTSEREQSRRISRRTTERPSKRTRRRPVARERDAAAATSRRQTRFVRTAPPPNPNPRRRRPDDTDSPRSRACPSRPLLPREGNTPETDGEEGARPARRWEGTDHRGRRRRRRRGFASPLRWKCGPRRRRRRRRRRQ
mmetsp:Transcript_24443/g.50309  ORF Transcript_24443/g.50309 Transcript_24443/m.50309 type:complete len:320 (+) Transcript_24443:894-1853(+)